MYILLTTHASASPSSHLKSVLPSSFVKPIQNSLKTNCMPNNSVVKVSSQNGRTCAPYHNDDGIGCSIIILMRQPHFRCKPIERCLIFDHRQVTATLQTPVARVGEVITSSRRPIHGTDVIFNPNSCEAQFSTCNRCKLYIV